MPEHELFPAEDEADEAPDVSFILVKRDGRFSPRKWAADELPDLEALHAAYGGGTYELTAYRHDGSRQYISARRTYKLAGRPKPLEGEEPEETAAPAEPARAREGSGSSDLLLALLQQSAQASRESVVAQRESQQAQTQMILAMLQHSATQTAAMLQQSGQQTASLMAALMQANASVVGSIVQLAKDQKGEDASSLLDKGIELGAQIAGASGGSDDELLGTIGQVVQGMQAAAGGAKPNGGTT